MPISAQHTKFEYPDYIAPLPADDLVKIALKKQELYDQGVAQVQSQVDAYTDLRNNLYRDVDKAYFDETMTKYVTAINSSAGLDFSKKANLNAVLNIGKPLEKDNNIISAIQNGREIQRRQKELKSLDQSKRNNSNDWFYMNDVQDYLNSDQLGVSLAKDKAYVEFYDISDKVMEYVKTFSKEQQDEFFAEMGKAGTPEGYIQKITQQGFNQTELANRVKSMLSTDPKAIQQLGIDARYNFNQLGKENAYKGYIEDQTLKEVAVSTRLQETQSAILDLEKSNAKIKSPIVSEQIKSLKQNLIELTQYSQQLKINSNKTIDQFNMEDYFEIYQNKFITNLANTYSTQKVSRDLKDDKIWDNMQKMNLEYYKATLDINKEKAKARIDASKSENLLKKKKEVWSMYNVAPQDLFNVPSILNDSSVNLDIDDLKLGDVFAEQKTLSVTPTPERNAVKEFFKLLNKGIDIPKGKESEAKIALQNRTFVINFKDGDTLTATGQDLFQIPISRLKDIESIAQANTIESFSARKKSSQFP